jgi:uncharacterized protein YkwD
MTTRRNLLRLAAAVSSAGPAAAHEDLARRVFDHINQLRVARDAPALTWSPAIAACAYEQSRRKAQLRFSGHNDPERGDIAARLRAAGIGWTACAENLFMEKGWDDPSNLAVVFWWYSTSGHQENLLNPLYTDSAIGIFEAEDGTFFVTQIFVTPLYSRMR